MEERLCWMATLKSAEYSTRLSEMKGSHCVTRLKELMARSGCLRDEFELCHLRQGPYSNFLNGSILSLLDDQQVSLH
jgi:hypothetical protein